MVADFSPVAKTLSDEFVALAPKGARSVTDLEAVLAALVARGRAAWPKVRAEPAGCVRLAAVGVAAAMARRRRGDAAGSVDEREAVPGASSGPEVMYLKKKYAADFRVAFQRTLAGLPDEDRNILSLHLFDQLTTEA